MCAAAQSTTASSTLSHWNYKCRDKRFVAPVLVWSRNALHLFFWLGINFFQTKPVFHWQLVLQWKNFTPLAKGFLLASWSPGIWLCNHGSGVHTVQTDHGREKPQIPSIGVFNFANFLRFLPFLNPAFVQKYFKRWRQEFETFWLLYQNLENRK